MLTIWFLVGCVLLVGMVRQRSAEEKEKQPLQEKHVVGPRSEPERHAFEAMLGAQLQGPTGFKVNVFAARLGQPRMMAVAKDGTVYVTRCETNDVVALHDSDSDGRANTVRVVIDNLDRVHGMTMPRKQGTAERFEAFLHEFLLQDGCAYSG
jgi:glucose/arabinose dehydrogenase